MRRCGWKFIGKVSWLARELARASGDIVASLARSLGNELASDDDTSIRRQRLQALANEHFYSLFVFLRRFYERALQWKMQIPLWQRLNSKVGVLEVARFR